MSTIVTRSGKGSPLTHNEVDANFTNLNTDKVEKTAADITGGTIDNTSIGATTPSTVNATTITGQTGVLRGTGTNLFLQSQTFDNAAWTKTNSSVTANTAAAPDGTTTADNLVENSSLGAHQLTFTTGLNSSVARTISIFVKQGERQGIRIQDNAFSSNFTRGFFNISTLTASTSVSGSGVASAATITSVGNGWFRCSYVSTPNTTGSGSSDITIALIDTGTNVDYTGNGTSGILLWGAQLEIGTTANTYIPTTTTAVYGTPTLSFSGVSSIGLLSNGALYLEPAGTGAIQADATTSTTAGGNTRGANAVDWQTSRSSASQVASGGSSTISGGVNNTASAFASAVGGGAGNTAAGSTGQSFVGGGQSNIGGSGIVGWAAVLGGNSNTAGGFYNVVGGGFTNSATSGSAVTTQATTVVTSGSTAVTLSATNASIRVGQYITGTGIASDTYVSAISTTSLTLSKNATATGTPTLSFFRPHGVVVGGGNNQATGSYSFIGGGGDAGTAANRNVASGDYSVVVGGIRNSATQTGAVVCGGGTFGSGFSGNTASGVSSFVGGGLGSTASGNYAGVPSGVNHTSNAEATFVAGGYNGNARAIAGNTVFPASISPVAFATGVSQAAFLVLGRQTTDATATALTSNNQAAGTTNQVILPNNSAYFFRGDVISGKTAGGDAKGWTIEGVIKRGANAASTALVGTPTVTSSFADAGASTWDIAVTADTTNGGLRVTFTGQAATTIRTVCQIRTTEMTF